MKRSPGEQDAANRTMNAEVRDAVARVTADKSLKTNESRRTKFSVLMGDSAITPEDLSKIGERHFPKTEPKDTAAGTAAEDRKEDRRIRRVDQQSAQVERLYASEFKAITGKDSSLKEAEKDEASSRLQNEKDRALELVQDGMSASEAKQRSRKEVGRKIKEPTSGTWKEIADQETSSAAKKYLAEKYGYSEQEAEDIIVTGIKKWYLEDHPKSRISEFIGRDQRRAFVDDINLVEKSKSRILPPRQSEAASPSSPPQEHRNLTLRQPSEPPVAAPVELPKPTSETWKEIIAQGTTSKAKAFLMKKYGYSAEEAVDVLRTGFKKGYVK